jgi:hypothetical protein
MRIKIVLLSILFLPFFAMADEVWEIKSSEDGYTIGSGNFSNIDLELVGPTVPKIVEKSKRSTFEIVVVNHGEVGTSCLVRIHKAYVFDTKKKKYVGVYPYRVIAVENKVKKCKVKAIKWEFFKNYIMIHDKNNNKKYKISAI